MNILITGASGFIGSFICEEALRKRHNVWAGLRISSSRKWLQNEWLNFVILDLANPQKLSQQLSSFRDKYGRWDVIIHAGGATKCVNKEDFELNNFLCTRNLVECLCRLDMLPEHFIYLSSLSVLGAIGEDTVPPHKVDIPADLPSDTEFVRKYTIQQSVYNPLLATSIPNPNTEYGKSKLMSEEYLKDFENTEVFAELKGSKRFNFTIFRPTGVYGPREKDYFIMAKSIANHYDFAAGFKPQEITFVYVQDLVNAIFASLLHPVAYGKTYNVSDGYVYNSRAFSNLIQNELGTRYVLHITAPLWLLKAICKVSGFIGKITGRTSTLNDDKYNILSQRNWQCDINPLYEDLGFIPQWNLERGVNATIKWYIENKWI